MMKRVSGGGAIPAKVAPVYLVQQWRGGGWEDVRAGDGAPAVFASQAAGWETILGLHSAGKGTFRLIRIWDFKP